MSSSVITNVTVNNAVDFQPQMHFIFFQEPKEPGLDTDVFVWRRLDIQSKGSGTFAVPFDIQYQASITASSGVIERSQRLSANSGDVLSVTMDKSLSTSEAPMLEKTGIEAIVIRISCMQSTSLHFLDTDTMPVAKSVHHVTVQNNYEGGKDVQITALKDKKPLVRQTVKTLHDQAQFEIHSVVYLAWHANLKEGDTFRSGTYSKDAKKIDLTDPKTGDPANELEITLSNKPRSRDINMEMTVVS